MEPIIKTLIRQVIQWGDDRNLTAPENLKAQTLKLVSEFGEIALAELDQTEAQVKDGIGDTIVVGLIISKQLGIEIPHTLFIEHNDPSYGASLRRPTATLGLFVDTVLKNQTEKAHRLIADFLRDVATYAYWEDYSVEECLAGAYGEIKDRKGVMYNGAFIKESDPAYHPAMVALGRAGTQSLNQPQEQ